jgi:glutathione S-transferase
MVEQAQRTSHLAQGRRQRLSAAVIKVYHSRRARSARVIWLLEELSVPYEIAPIAFDPAALKSPEYLKLHPLGLVPVVQDGALTIFESGAILEYLLETYGEGRLAPAPKSPGRAAYLQWFHFGEASLARPMSDLVRQRFRETDVPELMLVRSRARFHAAVAVVDRALERQPYVAGESFSAADIMVAYGLVVGRIIRELPAEFSNVAAYIERLKQRPAYDRAWS